MVGGKPSSANAEAIDLLEKLLKYDPEKRISCQEALKHAYFNTAPAPTEIEKLPKRKVNIEKNKNDGGKIARMKMRRKEQRINERELMETTTKKKKKKK